MKHMYSGITQEGSVHDYISSFKALSEDCKDLPEKYLMSVFVRVLKQPLQDKVRLLQLCKLVIAMDLAL